MKQNQHFYIDVKDILYAKAPQKAKKIPSFVIKAISKIIHQDEINHILRENEGQTGVDFMNNLLKYLNIRLIIKGEENIPDFNTKCIFASNHPLGGVDGISLSSILGNRYNHQIKYIVNDLLYFIKPLQSIFVPVNKHGSQRRDAAMALNEAFSSQNQILTFPAGLCSRKIKGKIYDLEWKKMLTVKAVEFKRNIVPVYFEAKNSNFFYSIANIRRLFRIKFNIEMLFLPHEMLKMKNKTFTVYFGESIPWTVFDSSKNNQQWTDLVKQKVYNLSKK